MRSSVFSIYSGPLRPGGWAGLGLAIATIGTVVFLIFSSRNLSSNRDKADQGHTSSFLSSLSFVTFSCLGKAVAAPQLDSFSVRVACAVVSFGGFIVISLYRYTTR